MKKKDPWAQTVKLAIRSYEERGDKKEATGERRGRHIKHIAGAGRSTTRSGGSSSGGIRRNDAEGIYAQEIAKRSTGTVRRAEKEKEGRGIPSRVQWGVGFDLGCKGSTSSEKNA